MGNILGNGFGFQAQFTTDQAKAHSEGALAKTYYDRSAISESWL